MTLLWCILQGTFVYNLRPCSWAGQKALDPNHCRQPTLWLHDIFLEVLTVHGTKFNLFGSKAFPPTHTTNGAHLTKQQ